MKASQREILCLQSFIESTGLKVNSTITDMIISVKTSQSIEKGTNCDAIITTGW